MKAETTMSKLVLAALLMAIPFSTEMFAASNVGGLENKVEQPSVLTAVAPVYPAVAIVKGIEGDVVVLATIDRAGKVLTVTSESGPGLLRKSAEGAAKRWIFNKTDVQEPRSVRIMFAFRAIPKKSNVDESVEFMPPFSVKVSEKIPELEYLINSDPPSTEFD